jgi:hypothetical protein
MPTRGPQARTRPIAVVLSLVCASVACRRAASEPPPVATPRVTVQDASVPRGSVIDVHYRFEVAPDAPPFGESYTVFVHAFDKYGNRIWTGDHEPPTAATQWKAGSVVEYTRPMMVPKGAPLGPVSLEVGLYSPRTGTRLPLAGRVGDRRSYRVASFDVVEKPLSESDVRFVSGWYESEAPEDAQGAEWRWSKRTAMLSARNPRHDAVFVVDVDQPLQTGAGAQSVEIQIGTSRIGGFTVPPGVRARQRVPVTATQLGDADVVRFTLSVDRTFTPAGHAGASSADRRELGIRVFSVSLEPVSGASSTP